MGTKKKRSFWGKNLVPLAARIRDESASSRRKRRSLDLHPPAPPSRLPLRPRTRPPGTSIPRLIKSSTHFRPPLPTRAQEVPKLAIHNISFRGTRLLLLYLRSDSTKINFAAVIIASRSGGPGGTAKCRSTAAMVVAATHRGGVMGGCIRDPRTKTSLLQPYASWFNGKLAVQSS